MSKLLEGNWDSTFHERVYPGSGTGSETQSMHGKLQCIASLESIR